MSFIEAIRHAGFVAPIALAFAILFVIFFWRGFRPAASPAEARGFVVLLSFGSALAFLVGSAYTASSSWEVNEMIAMTGAADPSLWAGDQSLLDVQRVLTAFSAIFGLLLAAVLFWFRCREESSPKSDG